MQQFIESFQSIIESQLFAQRVIAWQRGNGRNDLPWQNTADPYHVLVSELMLQQTQVTTVIPYYQRWLKRFPTLEQLATADTNEVMALWQGLGYYSRARNLHRAAQQICRDYAGKIPKAADELREITGIGAYTAGAIRAFAYDLDGVIVDGNVKRLFSRFFAIAGDLTSASQQRLLWQLAEHYTPPADNRRYAQGLLDLGATICTPRQPRCTECPLQEHCQALRQGRVSELPERKVKNQLPIRSGYFLWHASATGILLEQRPNEGIWPLLWCLPELDQQQLITSKDWSEHGRFNHTFSHYKLQAQIVIPSVSEQASIEPCQGRKQRIIAWHQLQSFGLPAPIAKYLRGHLPKPPPST